MNKNRMETSPSTGDIKKHLNAIDEELAKLIVRRSCYAAQAEQLNESADISEADVINKIKIPADIDPEMIKKIYSDIMNIIKGQKKESPSPLYEELKKYYY